MTPLARVAGRAVTTLDGLPDRDDWVGAFEAAGASQCGFCTPGIVMRVAALEPSARRVPTAVHRALAAHLCRCTGWQPIVAAVTTFAPGRRAAGGASRRAAIEGHTAQRLAADGAGAFADDTAPTDALVAIRDDAGRWHVAETLTAARALAGRVQGRRTTSPPTWPVAVPAGEWHRTLQTTWVEPAYLEPDASWCAPGGEPVTPLANGGAFGGKLASDAPAVAHRLAGEHGRPVRVVYTREDVVRLGPKRPPIGAGIRADGTGVVRVARTPGIAAAVTAVAPGLVVDEVDVAGPPTSAALRAAGSAEAAVLLSSLGEGPDRAVTVGGGRATAHVDAAGVHVTVGCGDPLDEVVMRSYATGAAHMALGWVRSEAIAVDADGVPLDLTIRSFGILRAQEVPPIIVRIEATDGPPVNGSDAVFAAVAAAAWRAAGFASRWPVGSGP